MWLEAPSTPGVKAPWLYVRSKLAEHWHVLPPEIDELPMSEITLQLRLWALEAEHRPPSHD